MYNNNFLNNQNYILGKSEKKELIIKFFVEKSIKHIFNILSWINNFINRWFVLFFISCLLIIVFMVFVNFRKEVFYIVSIFFAFIVLTISLLEKNNIDYPYSSIKKTYNMIYINNFKEYFLTNFKIGGEKKIAYKRFYANEDNTGEKLIRVIKVFSSFFFLEFFFNYIDKLVDIVFIRDFVLSFFHLGFLSNYIEHINGIDIFIYLIIVIGSLLLYINLILSIRFINLLFFPFFLIYELFVLGISFIYTFILKGIRGYSFIKKNPKTNILKKFNIIDKQSAENEIYKIKVKV